MFAMPGVRSSALPKSRPACGETPSVRRYCAPISSPRMRSGSPSAPVRLYSRPENRAWRSNACCCFSNIRYFGYDQTISRNVPGASSSGLVRWTSIRRSGSANGSGFSSSPFTSVKIAVLAPMPSASVVMAISVKTGAFSSVRMA